MHLTSDTGDAFLLQPGIYSTHGHPTLAGLLDVVWEADPGPDVDGSDLYVVSGFGTHNGGVAYFERFRRFVAHGGTVNIVLAGSKHMNTASQQLASGLLDAGANVAVIQRRHLMHAKLYGMRAESGAQALVVTSGNFTNPGVKLNIEAATLLGTETLSRMSFRWRDLWHQLEKSAPHNRFELPEDRSNAVWDLLYDEHSRRRQGRADGEVEPTAYGAMVLTLSHADTARIQAAPGTDASKGTQYFWLSKDAYDFFPPLTERNTRGRKATYSTIIDVEFVDVGRTENVRVTFEAENNLDFRLGTAPLRNSKVAAVGDMAILERRSEATYRLTIAPQGTRLFRELRPHATTEIGNRGKVAGFVSREELQKAMNS